MEATNNARDWLSVFTALFPGNRPQTLKVNMPETIMLGSFGFPVAWYYSSAKGLMRKKTGQQVTVRHIIEHFGQLYPDPQSLAAVDHCNFSSRVLTQAGLVERMESLMTTAADEGATPFCVQQFIPPRSNLRYISTYMKTEYSVTCETYPMAYDRRYAFPAGSDAQMAAATAQAAAATIAAASTQKSSTGTVGVSMPVQEAAMLNMKRITTSIVNNINRDMSRAQLEGLVLEFVVGAGDGKVYMTGILGTSWSGKAPSWEELAGQSPDAAIISDLLADEAAKKGKGRGGGSPQQRQRNQQSRSGPLPPRAGASIGRSPRLHTHSLTSSHSHTLGGDGKGKKGGGGGSGVHRMCRPPLVVELSRQLESYKEALQEQTEAQLEARDVGKAMARRAESLTTHNSELEREMEELSKKVNELSSGQEEREAELTTRVSHLDSANRALQATVKELEDSNGNLIDTLNRERSVTFGLLGEFQTKVAHLETTMQQQAEELVKLREENSTMKQSSIAKNLMGASGDSAQQLETLREQVKLAQVAEHELRLKHDALKGENEKLLRLLPLSTQRQVSAPKGARHQTEAMHIDDIVESQASPSTERDLVRQAMLVHAQQLQAVFKHYAPPAEHGRKRALSHEELVKFCRDCGFIDRNFTVAQLDILAAQVVAGQEHHAGPPVLSMSEFMELLVRIAGHRYRSMQYVADQVTALLENDVLQHAKMGEKPGARHK